MRGSTVLIFHWRLPRHSALTTDAIFRLTKLNSLFIVTARLRISIFSKKIQSSKVKENSVQRGLEAVPLVWVGDFVPCDSEFAAKDSSEIDQKLQQRPLSGNNFIYVTVSLYFWCGKVG